MIKYYEIQLGLKHFLKILRGYILSLFFNMKHQISSKFAFLMTKTTRNDI